MQGVYDTQVAHRSPDDPPQGVPGPAVKPVQEVIEAIHSHVVGGAIVEPASKHMYMMYTRYNASAMLAECIDVHVATCSHVLLHIITGTIKTSTASHRFFPSISKDIESLSTHFAFQLRHTKLEKYSKWT